MHGWIFIEKTEMEYQIQFQFQNAKCEKKNISAKPLEMAIERNKTLEKNR